MKEYREKKWSKIFFSTLSIAIFALMGWVIINAENPAMVVVGIAFIFLASYCAINSFVYRIYIDENFIEEKGFLKNKQIYFKDVKKVEVQDLYSRFGSDKKEITINSTVENHRELIAKTLLKVQDNERIVYLGNPIAQELYLYEIANSKILPDKKTVITTNKVSVTEVTLLKKGWLYRKILINTSDNSFIITYFGKGMGYECVFLDDKIMAKSISVWWYCPQLSFKFGEIDFSVNVRVYPWLTLRKFWIEVNNEVVYSES
ncbi:MAG TPA: hypothetical protein PKY82_24730 [Pyrinomonadaceae bacterium]|nr:hypothetical protein [Pyrinomonadaceae bacterium]